MDGDPQFRAADGSAIRIWSDTAKNNFLTEKTGRPIFDEAVFVEVITPGASGSSPVFEVKRIFHAEMNHPEPMYGMQYERFKDYITQFEKNEAPDTSMAGTPLSEWSEMSKSMAASLRASGVFTVDAVAALPDDKLPLVGPDGRTWREKAKAYIEAAADTATATAFAAERERMYADLADRDNQIKALAAQVQELVAAKAMDITAPPPPPPPEPEPEPTKAAGKKSAPLGDII